MIRKRICILRRAYYPAESHVRRNAETLVGAGYDVTVVCIRDAGEVPCETVSGVEIHRLPLKARRSGLMLYLFEYLAFFLMAFFKVARLEFKKHFDFVEADAMPNFLIFAALLPRIRGAHLILYMFESMPELWMQKKGRESPDLMVKLLMWEEKMSCRFADTVIACHDLAKQAVVDRGVPGNKITVILNVPDERVFPVSVQATEPAAEFRLIQHGTMTENYGIQVVLKALSLLNKELPVHYDIIGSGQYRPVLEKLSEELGVGGRVTFHGYVTRERLLELLRQSSAGIVPMLFEYQSPNKLFELVSLGKPVVASDRRTFKQHFGDEEILYFKTNNPEDLARAIETAFNRPENLKTKAVQASRRFNEYRWSKMQEKYIALYKGTGVV